MDGCRGNGSAIRRADRKELEDWSGETATKSPSRNRAIVKQAEGFLEAQRRREKALKVLEDTILFLEKITG